MKFLILALVAISVLATPALTQERDSTGARPFRISSINTALAFKRKLTATMWSRQTGFD